MPKLETCISRSRAQRTSTPHYVGLHGERITLYAKCFQAFASCMAVCSVSTDSNGITNIIHPESFCGATPFLAAHPRTPRRISKSATSTSRLKAVARSRMLHVQGIICIASHVSAPKSPLVDSARIEFCRLSMSFSVPASLSPHRRQAHQGLYLLKGGGQHTWRSAHLEQSGEQNIR